MDRLESLGQQLSQITMYDIKSMYNQAKNVVFNVSEMEAKVNEATNDDPWGASSTLMQEIAQGTFNFQQFNEIMPCIYSRFMDKEARQWRQIYKALQLLEYIIKHGSERVVDDARSHLSTIKMLRNFQYIDEKGKDQGINVRNRSNELVSMLSDLDKIRAERRKAKANRNKYTGVGNDGSMGFTSGGRYGSDSYEGGGGYSGGGNYDEYGSGGLGSGSGSGGGGTSRFREEHSKRGFEEYTAGDWEEAPRRSNSISQNSRLASTSTRQATSSTTTAVGHQKLTEGKAKETLAKDKPKEVDLLGFGEDPFDVGGSPPLPAVPSKASGTAIATLADDFGDFRSAPLSPPGNTATFDFLKPAPAVPTTVPSAIIQSPPQMQLPGAPIQPSALPRTQTTPLYMSPTVISPASTMGARPSTATSGAKPASSANFDDLWSMSLGVSSKPTTTTTSAQKSMKDLEKEKAHAVIWGSASNSNQGAGLSGGSDDLLL